MGDEYVYSNSSETDMYSEQQINEISDEERNIYLVVFACFLVLCGLVALFVFLVIIKFKRLISQFHYKFISNWSVITFVSYLSWPIIFRVCMVVFHVHVFTFIVLSFFVSVIINWCLITLMSVDYLLECHFQKSSLKFRRAINLTLTVTYGIGLLILSFVFSTYYKGYHLFLFAIVLGLSIIISYAICLLTYLSILVIHFIKLIKNRQFKRKTSVPLIFTGIFLLSWFFLFVGGVSHAQFYEHPVFGRISLVTFMIGVLNPIWLLIILLKIDHSFSASVLQILKCKPIKLNEDVERLCNGDPKIRFDVKEGLVGVLHI